MNDDLDVATEERTGRVPPHDLAAERAVIGGILLLNEALQTVLEIPLEPAHFYKDAHALIFEAMRGLFAAHQPVDSITLRERLVTGKKLERVGGDEYLQRLTDTIPTVANIEAHAKIVIEKSLVRRVIHASHEIAAEGYGPIESVASYLERAQRVLGMAAERRDVVEPVLLSSGVDTEVARWRTGERKTGYETGFRRLDYYTGGQVPGLMQIVAGRPGMGKTAFALALALGTARNTQVPVFFASIEMPIDQLAQRAVSAMAEVPSTKLRDAKLGPDEWRAVEESQAKIAAAPIYIDQSARQTILDISRNARRIKRKHGLSLIVVDYLQRMKPVVRGRSREEEVQDFASGLAELAKELHVPVLALSQINRMGEGGKDKRPTMSMLRESGAIEQDAAVVQLLYRDEVYNKDSDDKGVCEVLIDKNRNGPTGVVRVAFNAQFTKFTPLVHWDDNNR